MNERSMEHNQETFEKEMEILKQGWNSVLLDVLAKQYEKHGKDLPKDLEQSELLEKAPHFLELLTEPKEIKGDTAFLVLTAPTGVGKGTVGKQLRNSGIPKLPRVNTRPIRPGEVDGQDYYFVDEKRFGEMVNKGEVFCVTSTAEESKEASQDELIGDTKTAKTRAGIPLQEFSNRIKSGHRFYIDGGAGTARKIKSEEVTKRANFQVAFLLPPSFTEMKRRVLKRRGEETVRSDEVMSDETLLDRFRIAINHLRQSVKTVDGYVVNDRVQRASEKLEEYFESK